jgi:hypothetical protein
MASRKFQVSELARFFGVPPHLVGDVEKSTSWGTGIEQQNLAFSSTPCSRISPGGKTALPAGETSRRRRYHAEHNLDGLLRGDSLPALRS